ncbi:hypothetical protein K1T71_005943 [Dendrolimus kikuchii]|uniref:Uncharacterized protein n=1 Tax=Dendrolimus kikuchii TaxID=765133 RepID=A0ACC1D2S3_9NEOP|nr:hypothetical protein K1T71_005943 [Dendrolimus kikuchii]
MTDVDQNLSRVYKVEVYKTQESKVKTDSKHGTQEKPRQLFWEKRLEDNVHPAVCLCMS